MEPVVHLRAAVALLGRFPALAGIDLDVARGEIVLLRGPNGAGKTTVLHAMVGALPFSGSVSYGGTRLSSSTQSELRRREGAGPDLSP